MQNQKTHGVIRNSRKEANFVSRMQEDERVKYIKQTAASYHAKLLMPYICITKYDRFHRENTYKISDPATPIESGVLYQSRRNSDYLKQLPKRKRFC